jgi:hypothetical protein
MDFRVMRRVHSDVISAHLDDAVDDDLFSSVDLQGLVVLACDEDMAMYCSRWWVKDVQGGISHFIVIVENLDCNM